MSKSTPLRLPTLMVVILTATMCSPTWCVAEDPVRAGNRPVIREIFVPFEDLNILLEGQPKRVFLTRDQYEELLGKAKQTPDLRAPIGATIVSARYVATMEESRARIAATIAIEVLERGVQALPLELSGVGVLNAWVDDESAAISRNDRGQIQLFVKGEGQRELRMELVAPLQTAAAQQSLNFHVPTPASTQFELIVPGNVELKNGANVISRTLDSKSGTTRFLLLPQPGPTTLVMSLSNRMQREQQIVVARGVMVDEVTEAYERLHATVSLSMLHGASEEFQFEIPDGFEVTDVTSPLLARFAVEDVDSRRILTVTLREASAENVLLNISAIKTPAELSQWKVPQLKPIDVASYVAVVGLLLEDRLQVSTLDSAGLIPIDNPVLTLALPESVFRAEPGAPRIRPLAAYYAPQPDFQLSADFDKPPAQLNVSTNIVLTLDEQIQKVRGRFALLPEREKLFQFQFSVPDGWTVTDVTRSEGGPLSFDSFADADGSSRVLVRLPGGMPPDRQTAIFFEATSAPAGWIGNWMEQTVDFPAFAVVGAARDTGAIGIDAVGDYSVRPDQLTALTPLDEEDKVKFGLSDISADLTYRYDARPFAASLRVERIQPLITARTYSFLKVEAEGLSAHYEILYDVQQARTRRLLLRLPESTPSTISIRGLNGIRIKEYTSEIVNGERLWTVLLAEARQGQVRLAASFQTRLEEAEPKDFSMPAVKAGDVAYQTSIVAVEGGAELDIEIKTDARSADVGELAGAEYQVGRRLLGAYGFLGEPGTVTVDVFRRPGYRLPAAIVQRAELVTLVSTSGLSQTGARYQLRTKAPFLEIQLPANSTLWSVLLGGEPAKPQREGDSLLISLSGVSGLELRDLQIVFETPVKPIGGRGELRTTAPRLFLRTETGKTDREVPVADLVWHLDMPAGYRIVKNRGTVYTTISDSRDLAVTKVASSLVEGAATRMGATVEPSVGAVEKYSFDRGHAEMVEEASDEAATFAPATQATGGESPSPRDRVFGDGVSREAGVNQNAAETAEPPTSDAFGIEFKSSPSMGGTGSRSGDAARNAGDDAENGREEGRSEDAMAMQRDSGTDTSVANRPRSELGEKQQFWALEGVSSLNIDVRSQQTGECATFRSLGVAPELMVTLADSRKMRSFAWGIALVIGLIGLLLTPCAVRVKIRYLVIVAVIATALPLVTGLIHDLSEACDLTFYVVCLLALYYVAAGAARWVLGKIQFRRTVDPTAITALLACFLLSSTATAQEPPAFDPQSLLPWLKQLAPVTLPQDAVVIPFDAEKGMEGAKTAEKILVPYEKYVDLWNRAYPNDKIQTQSPAAPYALAGARYEARLSGDQYLLLTGMIHIDVLTNDPVSIPLPLEGGVLAQSLLDGKPARVRVAVMGAQQTRQNLATNPPPGIQRQQALPVPASGALMVLQTEGKGRKQLELSIRLRLERRGGWRIAQGRVPAALATLLKLQVPAPRTEVRLSGVHDRQNYETSDQNESIETALTPEGSLHLQWRPKVAEAQVDQSLTVESAAVLDVQEDGLRLNWRMNLQFRRSRRGSFEVDIPGDYLLERVVGKNVRGWEVEPSADRQRLEITLLKEVADSATLTVVLSRRGMIGTEDSSEFTVPYVSVPDAALNRGMLQIRRSPLLDLRTADKSGLVRTDASAELTASVIDAARYEESPLGIQPFQAYRFVTTPFVLGLATEPVNTRTSADIQMVMRIAERDVVVEAQLNLQVQDRPIHRVRIAVPDDLEIMEVSAPGTYEWSLTGDERRIVSIFFAEGQQNKLAVVLRGKILRSDVLGEVPLPRLEVLDVERQQGAIAIQVDPAYTVSAAQLINCEAVLRDRLYGWLNPEQRPVTQMAIAYRAADFSGVVQMTARRSRVNVFTISNVKVTETVVQETILLGFTVHDAGIRQVAFLLPDWLADSHFEVPLLRQKSIASIDQPAGHIRVLLELQDEVMGEFQVLVQHDRLLSTEKQSVPIPIVETGETDERFVVLESAGRDEVVVDRPVELEPLTRHQSQRRRLAGILGSGLTQAYIVRNDATDPQLSYQTNQRRAVQTAGARIGKAETVLVLDGNGAYRAAVEYRMNNDTEQFLEISLPDDAQLWTATVAGEPVKPTLVPGATSAQLVRIPLIKTAQGDADYPVILKYGGQIDLVGSTRSVNFPLVRTGNINVELSQVRLLLPESHRWFQFGGTMRHVLDEGEYRAGDVIHLTKQIRRAAQGLSSENVYTRLRSENNLKQIRGALRDYRESFEHYTRNDYFKEQLELNGSVFQQAEEQLRRNTEPAGSPVVTGNRDKLDDLWRRQENERSKNIVKDLKSNFQYLDKALPQEPASGSERGQFNRKWLQQNKLQNEFEVLPGDSSGRIAQAGKKPLADGPNPAGFDRQWGGREGGFAGGGGFGGGVKGEPSDPANNLPAVQAVDDETRYRRRLEAQSESLLDHQNSARDDEQDRDGEMSAQFGQGPVPQAQQSQSQQQQQIVNVSDFVAGPDYLASLDVNLPLQEGGVEYFFTMPRGDIQITARAVEASIFERLTRLLWIAIVLVGALLVLRLASQFVKTIRTGSAA